MGQTHKLLHLLYWHLIVSFGWLLITWCSTYHFNELYKYKKIHYAYLVEFQLLLILNDVLYLTCLEPYQA